MRSSRGSGSALWLWALWLSALWLCAGPLDRGAAVPLPGGEPECGPDEYKAEGLDRCCNLCPPGSHVSRHCDVNHRVPVCTPCGHGSFLAYANGETSCQLCTQCRADQEVVAVCTQTSDRQCQCKTGSFYCDSPNCVESCFRCHRCLGPVLRPCNATHDTVCESEPGPAAPGKTPPEDVSDRGIALVCAIIATILSIVSMVVLGIYFCCRKKKGVMLQQWFISFLKRRADRPGSTTCPGHSESPVPLNPDTEQPGTDIEMSSLCGRLDEEGSGLLPEAEPDPGPSEEPAEGTELQQGAVAGSPAASQQALQTAAPAAPGPPSLRTLQQKCEAEYFVRDPSSEARMYYEFERRISDKYWRALMRLVGLEDSDIDNCEYQYPDNLMEQHHRMLLTWRTQRGKEASVFTLLAALNMMELRMPLENITNRLLEEGILGRRAETTGETD